MITGTACGLVRDRMTPPKRLAPRNAIEPQMRIVRIVRAEAPHARQRQRIRPAAHAASTRRTGPARRQARCRRPAAGNSRRRTRRTRQRARAARRRDRWPCPQGREQRRRDDAQEHRRGEDDRDLLGIEAVGFQPQREIGKVMPVETKSEAKISAMRASKWRGLIELFRA